MVTLAGTLALWYLLSLATILIVAWLASRSETW